MDVPVLPLILPKGKERRNGGNEDLKVGGYPSCPLKGLVLEEVGRKDFTGRRLGSIDSSRIANDVWLLVPTNK